MTAGCRFSLLNGNMKTSHCFMSAPLSFEAGGSADDGRFSEPVLLPDFFFAVAVGEVARRPDGNGVYGGNFLQNKTVFSAHDVHGLALSGLFHQPPQIGLGAAQAETVRPQVKFSSSERTVRNSHRLTVACLWAGVE